MIASAPAPSHAVRRSLLARLLFPATETRIAMALLITFFPYGILYSAAYPVSELITVAAWVWVFPSIAGWLSIGLLPLVINAGYGYFVFNLFCIAANMAVSYAALTRASLTPDLVAKAYKAAKVCMALTFILCLLQMINPPLWMSAVPGIMVPAGRGAGLRSEPALLAGPLAIFLSLMALRMEATLALKEPPSTGTRIYLAGIAAMLLLVGITLSLSVLAVVLCFAPMLFLRRRHVALQASSLATGAVIAFAAFGDRIRDAMNSGGSFMDMITLSVASWRNIPDILVIVNYSSYIWPGNPSEVRAKLNGFAVAMNPGLSWLQFTYSTFSASATTVGLVATVILFLAGLRMGMKHLSAPAGTKATWVLLFVVNWFLAPKYDACGWIALGLLPWLGRLSTVPRVDSDAPVTECERISSCQTRGVLKACAAVEIDTHGGGLSC